MTWAAKHTKLAREARQALLEAVSNRPEKELAEINQVIGELMVSCHALGGINSDLATGRFK